MEYYLTKQEFINNVKNINKPLIGTFKKSNTAYVIEINANVGFDFILIDAEQAPFSRSDIDILQVIAKASNIPALVRIQELSSSNILTALDCGACGIVAPHIDSKEKAQKFVNMSKYSGHRGFSNSPRAGNYGERKLWEHVDSSDNETIAIAMIEDKLAVDNIEDILSVEGLDAVFIGRGDLMVNLKDREPDGIETRKCIEIIINACRKYKKPVLIVPNSNSEIDEFFSKGIVGYICGSDQNFLKFGATKILNKFKSH